MDFLSNINISRDKIAEILKVTPEQLDVFEREYSKASMLEAEESDNLFEVNSRQAVSGLTKNNSEDLEDLKVRIIKELLNQTDDRNLLINEEDFVTKDEIYAVPEDIRPQLTGRLIKKDIKGATYPVLMDMLFKYQETGDKVMYHMFRQGLDILDLDAITYEVLGMNRNSIGFWFPALKKAADKQSFFKIPNTKIIKVPLPILQLTSIT